MKKVMNNLSNLAPDEMLPGYDFTGKKGVRGKYYVAILGGVSCAEDGIGSSFAPKTNITAQGWLKE